MKVNPKSNKLIEKKQDIVVTDQQEQQNMSDVLNDWKNGNVGQMNPPSVSQVVDSISLESGISNRVVGMVTGLGGLDNSSSESTLNPFMPTSIVKGLPSKNKPYKLLTLKPEIYYKTYKVGELKKLTISKMSTPQLFDEIMKGIEANFDKYKITLADFTYIGLLRRISTLRSAKFNANYECESCGFQNSKVFDNTKLEFKDLNCDLPVSVDFDGKEYIFTPLTVEDYLMLYELDLLDDSLAYSAIMCRNTDIQINYPETTKEGIKLTQAQRRFFTIYDIFYNLNSYDDGEIFDLIDTDLDHRLKPVVMDCDGLVDVYDVDGKIVKDVETGENKKQKCTAKQYVTLDGGGVVITPFRESNESLRSRIRYGTKEHN